MTSRFTSSSLQKYGAQLGAFSLRNYRSHIENGEALRACYMARALVSGLAIISANLWQCSIMLSVSQKQKYPYLRD